MTEDARVDGATVQQPPPGEQLQLVVLDDRGSRAHALVAGRELVLGRGEEVDVRIDDRSISRRHAILRVGRTVQIEDLGSSNGTQVRGRRLAAGERADLQPGELFEIGNSLCALRGRLQGDRPRRLAGHGYFEARLDDECALAGRTARSFAVARLHAPSDVNMDAELLGALRPGDVAASYGVGEYELLLLECSPEDAARIADAVRRRFAAVSRDVRVGLAHYPRDGLSSDALLARACAAVRPAPRRAEDGASPGVIVADERMAQLHRLVDRIARGDISVLLLGETGVGKEVFAERMHARSPRADKPLVRINCAGFSEALLESELFGHERGAFTGAAQAKPGLLETAQGGSVFFDEVGELPLPLQAKLLRVLEDRTVRRVGALKPVTLDVRFIAATNRDLEAEVSAGRFRPDLYFRLSGFSLVIPPLRERPGEIVSLARFFVATASRQAGAEASPEIDDEALAALRAYAWPGNARELRNMMERAVLLAGGETITLAHLPVEKLRALVVARPIAEPVAVAPATARPGAKDAGRDRILDALARSGGNQSRAAELLGISRRTLGVWLDRHRLPRPRKGR